MYVGDRRLRRWKRHSFDDEFEQRVQGGTETGSKGIMKREAVGCGDR